MNQIKEDGIGRKSNTDEKEEKFMHFCYQNLKERELARPKSRWEYF
jgi:hypothetical protein